MVGLVGDHMNTSRPAVRSSAMLVAIMVLAAACGSSTLQVEATGDTVEPSPSPPALYQPTPTPGLVESPTPGPSGAEEAVLDEAVARWEAAELSTYSYSYTRVCLCTTDELGPNTVLVRDDVVVEVRDGFDQPVDAIGLTVDELFAEARESIAAGKQNEIAYDDVHGYPTSMNLDIEAQAVDGGFNLSIHSFSPLGTQLDELEAARERWDVGRPESYAITYRIDCFCPPDQRITVVVDATDIVAFESDAELSLPQLTVDDMFDVIQEALEGPVASVFTEYEPTLGYPTTYFIDESEMIADEEQGVTVEIFEVT